MANVSSGGIPASAGYTQYVNTLVSPKFSDRIIGQVYCRSIAGEFTRGDYGDGLAACGNTIGFKVEPEIDFYDYQKNQTLKSQTIETEWRYMTVDCAKYFNVKIDQIDQKQVCDWDTLASRFCENASKRMHVALDPEVLIKMAVYAHKRNKGKNAGVNGTTDLGTYGDPLVIDDTNITDLLVCLQVVLEEQCRWEDGHMCIAFPTQAKKSFFQSELANYCSVGERSPLLNGKLRDDYMGFKIIFTNHSPRFFDEVAQKWAYYVVAAHDMATGFVQQIDTCEKIKMERTFGDFYRGLWVYGHQTLIPEAVAVAYVTFS